MLLKSKNQALTLVEVLVIVCVLAVAAVIILPGLAAAKRHGGPNCANNLKQIGLAYRIWAGDNEGKYPMNVSVTNGGTLEIFNHGSQFKNLVFLNYLTMCNELGTPKILHCPADSSGIVATHFSAAFNNQNVSYFVGLDASADCPQSTLSGDDNFETSSVSVKSGVLEVSTNTPITWSAARHKFTGNIALADGSIQSVSNSGLTNLIQQTDFATNRLAIP